MGINTSSARKSRPTPLAARVAEAGGIDEWNAQEGVRAIAEALRRTVTATTVDEALEQVRAAMAFGHLIHAYAYMRTLRDKDAELYYATILAAPELLLPVVYTPTVGEACQKFGLIPLSPRGCYVSITQRGNFAAVLREYASAHLKREPDGTFGCDCIVFSDGGRILGLGDLGAWGMGIPLGKLDLYTVCAGVDPFRTVPVILDMGVSDPSGNTARLQIREHPLYTGLRQPRAVATSAAGTKVNAPYYGANNVLDEFMEAAVSVFGRHVLLQFEDFNSNDAFPLLAATRDRFLTYNDDIQGTAAVTVAGILGGLRLRHPHATDLVGLLRSETFLFHGAGSANVGAASLLASTAGVPLSAIYMTNSRGLIWRAAGADATPAGLGAAGAGARGGDQGGRDGPGNFRNLEQKRFAHVGKPAFESAALVDIIAAVRPTVLVGAVGLAPGCFDRLVVDAMMQAAQARQASCSGGAPPRPIIFALSNPKTQAEISAEDCYTWSGGMAIFGTGTQFDPVTVKGRTHAPGQVNNVYIFPGLSFGAAMCRATTLPDQTFLAAAEAVAQALSDADLAEDRVVPRPARIREVGLSVATATVLSCQHLGLATRRLGESEAEVRASLKGMMWTPSAQYAAKSKL